MESIYLAIMEMVKNNLPGVAVDEDTGQLQALLNGADGYPVTFPCVLIGDSNVQWENIGLGVQKGTGTLTIRLAIDCYHDSHLGSGTEHRILERLQLNNRLYVALQEKKLPAKMGKLVRTGSRDYGLPGNIKVYETDFKFTPHDESAAVAIRR